MCGFVGFIGGGDTQRDQGVLQSMTDAIRHRGPDDADYYMDGEISLVSRVMTGETYIHANVSGSSSRISPPAIRERKIPAW